MIYVGTKMQRSVNRLASWVFCVAFSTFLLFAAAPAHTFCFCPECLMGAYDSYQPVSGSMKPTIEPGACVVVKWRAAIDRGDILVFSHPTLPDSVVVKRLIGIPGDTVELRDGAIILNGNSVPQADGMPYTQKFENEGPQRLPPVCPYPTSRGEVCIIHRQTEVLPNGISWEILDVQEDGFGDNFGPITVTAGYVFVLGDHRDNSIDSRVSQEASGLGFIPLDSVIGPVTKITNP